MRLLLDEMISATVAVALRDRGAAEHGARGRSGQDEVVIGRAGEPVAVLTRYERDERPRELGGWAGRVHIADDLDEPLQT